MVFLSLSDASEVKLPSPASQEITAHFSTCIPEVPGTEGQQQHLNQSTRWAQRSRVKADTGDSKAKTSAGALGFSYQHMSFHLGLIEQAQGARPRFPMVDREFKEC